MKLSSVTNCMLLLMLALHLPVSADNLVKDTELTQVNVQLKWFHQYQFAGFYSAIEQGYFAAAGLEVNLIEGGPTIDPVDRVVSGEAHFGVGNSSLLVDYYNGRPVKVVSAIFQHSPFIILANRNDDIRSVTDLKSHRLMLESHAAELLTYLKLAGVNLKKMDIVPHTGNIGHLNDSAKSIDAMSAYSSTEPYWASKLNIPYQIFSPRELNINFYADTLFTTQQYAQQFPNIVIAMRDALNKGWDYASAHHDEVITHILQSYELKPGVDRLALNYEAQVTIHLLEKDIVDIGYMSFSRWESIAENFVKAGQINKDYSLEGFMFEVEQEMPLWAFNTILGAFLFIVLGSLVITYIISLNKKLNASLVTVAEQSRSLEQANRKLSVLSNTDALTSIANRRRFDEVIAAELARSKRFQHSLILLIIDVDQFKEYNDCYGHPAGDLCLKTLADIFKHSANRASDLVARYGGEEFAIITSGMDRQESQSFANNICEKVAQLSIPHPQSSHSIVTISIGVAYCKPEKETVIEDVIDAADVNLYQAKSLGRNRVIEGEVAAKMDDRGAAGQVG